MSNKKRNWLIAILVVLVFYMFFSGYTKGRQHERIEWVQTIDSMKVQCMYSPQPVTFPTGELFLIKAESYGKR